MTTLVPRLFSDLGGWFETELRPWDGLIRIEDNLTDGEYTIRAEMPGIDPDKDLTVTVANGMLSMRAERRKEVQARDHSEFRYGMLHRTMRLPAGVEEEKIVAKYRDGILTVTVPVGEPPQTGRQIPIEA